MRALRLQLLPHREPTFAASGHGTLERLLVRRARRSKPRAEVRERRLCLLLEVAIDVTKETVRLAGVPQSFWAVWDRERRELHHERTTFGRGDIDLRDGVLRVRRPKVSIELALVESGDPVEVLSPHGASYIWTPGEPSAGTSSRASTTLLIAANARYGSTASPAKSAPSRSRRASMR